MKRTAWRILKPQHASAAFDGEGARRYGGRWNSPGVPLVYTASTKALAALELLVHLPSAQVLAAFVCLRIEFDERLMHRLENPELPPLWRADPPPLAARAIGDQWQRAGGSAILEVPSAIVPEECNYLLNPAHPHFQNIAIGEVEKFYFDPRLLKP